MAIPTKIIPFPKEKEKKVNIVSDILAKIERLEMIACCHESSIDALNDTVCNKKVAWGAGRNK